MQRVTSFFKTSPDTENNKPLSTGLLFGIVWVLLFVLYYPAARAGFVTDFTGWLDQVKNHSFATYINRTNFRAVSLYQFTQLCTYIFYKLFGISPWAWHLLFITLHAINACLLYAFSYRLLRDAQAVVSRAVPVIGVLLFCISPYQSEVIVWEPSFHFLTGLMFILIILRCVQEYMYTGANKYAWIAGIVYLLSTFTLEVFYITPWVILATALFYRSLPMADVQSAGNVIKKFFVPTLLLFIARVAAFYVIYGSWVSRIGSDTVTSLDVAAFGKSAKYLFHLLFVGRFFGHETRQQVYAMCDSVAGVSLFYALVAAAAFYMVTRFKKMSGKVRVVSLLFVLMLITLALLIPVWFANSQLVLFDRYTYFTGAFFYVLFAVLVSSVPKQNVRILLFVLFVLVNLRFAVMVSRYWGKSAKTIHTLLTDIPDAGNKTILLLNLPENLNGTAMIGSEKDSEYKLMHNLLLPEKKINNNIYDVLSYNMTTPTDGAHVTVANDSTIHVTLNQWGTWWWYEGKGGYSYENSDYKLNLADPGHWYELTLKKPADQYLLLYSVGDNWKVVDMRNKNGDQN